MSARGGRRQRGIALVIVLWIVALLAVLVGTRTMEARSRLQLARYQAEAARAAAAAQAGAYYALWQMTLAPQYQRIAPDGAPHDIDLGGAVARVSIAGDADRVDINTAQEEDLAQLFERFGAAPNSTRALAQAVMDFRDADAMRRPAGAEDEDYRNAGLDHGPRNGPFLHPDELAQVLGMPDDLFRRVRAHVTIARTGTAAFAAFIAASRARASGVSPTAIVPNVTYAIDSTGSAGQARTNVSVLAVATGNRAVPYRIVAWDGAPPAAQE
ncbi:MAG: general secretion pathway protein GspK [Gammaproteobacteria bacterium]